MQSFGGLGSLRRLVLPETRSLQFCFKGSGANGLGRSKARLHLDEILVATRRLDGCRGSLAWRLFNYSQVDRIWGIWGSYCNIPITFGFATTLGVLYLPFRCLAELARARDIYYA